MNFAILLLLAYANGYIDGRIAGWNKALEITGIIYDVTKASQQQEGEKA